VSGHLPATTPIVTRERRSEQFADFVSGFARKYVQLEYYGPSGGPNYDTRPKRFHGDGRSCMLPVDRIVNQN
jgi:hypothetical protein